MLDYKKLYATLLGRVDDALQYMVYDINDPKRIIETAGGGGGISAGRGE